MKYLTAIEPGDDENAFGVVIPDLPGWFSAGNTLEEALRNGKAAAELWMESELDNGRAIPAPSSFEKLRKNPGFEGWIWSVIDVDPEALSDKSIRVNITLPARVLTRLDRQAKAAGETRSGFIAKLVISNPAG